MPRRWINTHVIYDAKGRVLKQKGYWYDGPIDLAAAMANFDQLEYAFYDEGTESGSLIIGTKNNQQTLTVDTNYQCRFVIQEDGGAAGSVKSAKAEYNHAGAGWVDITTVSSVVQAVDDDDLTDGNDTTQRLAGSGTFITTNGWICEDGQPPLLAYNSGENCELLLSFQIIGADVTHGDEILLRYPDCDTYTVTADIDVNKPAATRRIFIT